MRYFALMPAAGSGSRMGGELPKQYQLLAGRPLIHHALAALAAVPAIAKIYVVLAPDDVHWEQNDWGTLSGRIEVLRCGGETRSLSVTNGLAAMAADDGRVSADDWVLVHDAARACLAPAHVDALIREVGDDPVGGILAVPLADTLKRAGRDGDRIDATVSREGLWQAQTPQMFRHGMLLDALRRTPDVTDEAGAIEALGVHPKLVAADTTNFKVTWPLDLRLAELILQQREAEK